ncbi:MAG: MerR family transcriptional regulator [Chloroflexota bacterium]
MKKLTGENELLTPGQMSQQTGVSIDTLRYYEREGLLQSINRNTSGHRRYNADDVRWVEVLRCLRTTGMSMEQLRTYCQLGDQGEHTQPERLELLLRHRRKVVQDIEAMQQSLILVDHKIDFYKKAIKMEGKQ